MDNIFEKLILIYFQHEINQWCTPSEWFQICGLYFLMTNPLIGGGFLSLHLICGLLEQMMIQDDRNKLPMIIGGSGGIGRGSGLLMSHAGGRDCVKGGEWVLIWYIYCRYRQMGYQIRDQYDQLIVPKLLEELRIEYD